MKIIVLGSGVVGVTSAWYLAQAGHEVTVADRQPAAGMETSFANAGQVSPGMSAPWAGPDTPKKAVLWLMMKHRPLVFWPMADPALIRWVSRFLANCNAPAYARNKGRMVRLAEYSRDRLRDLRHVTGIGYDDRQQGTLQLFRTQAQADHVGDDTAVLDRFNVPYEILDRAGAIAREPALASVSGKFVGGLMLPGDETGDAHLFTQRLAALAEAAGVVFRYNTRIDALLTDGGRITGIATDGGVLTADSYVVALGSYSPALLKQAGIELPVYPVKGYSLTMPVTDEAAAPVSTVMDETFKVAITRLGDRIRVRRHSGTGGLLDAASRAAPAHAGAFRERPVPAWRRSHPREVLDRSAADDAGWTAGDRRHELPEFVAEHRPWNARLDDVMRQRSPAGGPGKRQAPEHRARGSVAAALRQGLTHRS